MSQSLRPVARVSVLALAAAAAVAGCGGGTRVAAPTPSPSPSPTASPTPAAPPPPVGPPSPLSGLPARAGSPVLAVKIDNTRAARPQAGLTDADVVYVEEVEGGLTRLLAIFSSRVPAAVGPIRSVRTDNVELLRQYGAPAFAYSGGQPAALSVVRGSALLDVSYDAVPSLYRREPGRRAPYDLFADARRLLASRPAAKAAVSAGFIFDETRPRTTGLGARVSLTYPSALIQLAYREATHDYAVIQDGAPAVGADGRPITAANVVVQRVQQVFTGLKDINGNFSPANLTVGSGEATVVRDGHSLLARWSRPTATAGTRLQTTGTGADVALRPGTTWVLLAPAHSRLTLG